MDKEFNALKESLIENLKQELVLQEDLKELNSQKEKLLEKILPFIKAATYAGDYFMLRKDFELDLKDVPNIELQPFQKEQNTVIDTSRLKRAIKSGLPITGLKIKERLICYKKKVNLRDTIHV